MFKKIYLELLFRFLGERKFIYKQIHEPGFNRKIKKLMNNQNALQNHIEHSYDWRGMGN